MVMWAIILCGLLSIVYGIYTVRAVMAPDPGTARMQEIAAAIQEGAQAYLARQYTTIAIAGAVIFVIVWRAARLAGRDRLPHRRRAVGCRRLHRHEGLGPRQRAHRAGRHPLAGRGLSIAFRAGAVTGMLVAGLALLGVAVYFMVLTPLALRRPAARWSTRWWPSASAPR